MRQQTLRGSVNTKGIGIHTGKEIQLTLQPAPENTGIIFRRIDSDMVAIPAHLDYVSDTQLSTCLTKNCVRIATIEHLMSALAGFGIDNLYVDLDASELPIMDGSASPFVSLIRSVGIKAQAAAKQFIRIKRPIRIDQDDKWVQLEPFHGFKVTFSIDYDHPIIKVSDQQSEFNFSTDAYIKEISRARTFGFLSQYQYMLENNLARGADLSNTLVLDNDRLLNDDELRYPDEFVKHKVLDAIGDLYLLGYGIIGSFTGYKSGHSLNNQLLRALIANKAAWELVTFDQVGESPISYSIGKLG